jgi:hypothetical protein
MLLLLIVCSVDGTYLICMKKFITKLSLCIECVFIYSPLLLSSIPSFSVTHSLTHSLSLSLSLSQFEDERDARDSVEEMDGRSIMDKRVRVEISRRGRGGVKTAIKLLSLLLLLIELPQ